MKKPRKAEIGDYVTIRTIRCGTETVEARYIVDTIAWDDSENGNGETDQIVVRDGPEGDCGGEKSVITSDDVVGVYATYRAAKNAALFEAAKTLAYDSGIADDSGDLLIVCKQAIRDGEGTPERVHEIWAEATRDAAIEREKERE